MVISIPPEIERYVAEAIAAGRFDSAEEALREAFGLLQQRDRQVESLRRDVKAGFDQLDRDEATEMDEAGLRQFFDDLQAQGRQRYEAHKGAT
jgi:putative addiction module CopG family antidote